MTATSFKTYDPPPAGFDLRTASARELRRYGLPRRPDPETEPELHAHWQHAVAHTRSIIRAELGNSPALDRLSAARRRRHAAGVDGHPEPSYVTGWGGAIVYLENIGVEPPATLVSARWMVPTTTNPPNPSGIWFVASWVGIDGDPVLQAGIIASSYPKEPGEPTSPEVSYTAFTAWTLWDEAQWYVPIQNFGVSAGDIIDVSVCNTTALSGTQHGAVSFLNEFTGVATTVGVDPQPGYTAPGTQVEWIVLPDGGEYLPDFQSVVFLNCAAGTHQQSFGVNGATTTEVSEVNTSAALTQTEVMGSDTVAVTWLGSS
jgi:Peptidase A4 family